MHMEEIQDAILKLNDTEGMKELIEVRRNSDGILLISLLNF